MIFDVKILLKNWPARQATISGTLLDNRTLCGTEIGQNGTLDILAYAYCPQWECPPLDVGCHTIIQVDVFVRQPQFVFHFDFFIMFSVCSVIREAIVHAISGHVFGNPNPNYISMGISFRKTYKLWQSTWG